MKDKASTMTEPNRQSSTHFNTIPTNTTTSPLLNIKKTFPWLWEKNIIGTAIMTWIATRLLTIGLSIFCLLFIPLNSNLPFNHPSLTSQDFIQHWWIWDAGWYVLISQNGYTLPNEAGFFPLYPLLIHLITSISSQFEPLLVGMIINNIGTLFAFIAIALLVHNDEGDEQSARFTLRALAAYPFAIYLFAPYSEGLFLGLAAWTLLAIRRGWWMVAIITAILSGLARPFGIILIFPMLWEFGRQHQWWSYIKELWIHRGSWQEYLFPTTMPSGWWRSVSLGILVTLSAPIGIGIYAFYCWNIFNDPLFFLHAQQHFNEHSQGGIWEGIMTAIDQWIQMPAWSYPHMRQLVDIVPLAVCFVVSLVMIKRIPFAYSLYSLGAVAVCLATPSLTAIFPDVYVSAGRYMLVTIPFFMIVGRWTRNHLWLETILIQGGWAFQAVMLIFLFNGGWLV
jgi:hypothetical protein